jgi:hypothetical protein
MCSKQAIVNCKSEKFECLGPLALKAVAFLAGVAVFVPLVAAFAAPFIG